VRLDPASAAYWNSLGMVLGGSGALKEAEAAFREAVSRRPSEAEYAYNLGLVLQRAERGAEAAPFFRKALALDPGFTPARKRLEELGR
jgi:Flp pilus assembly protein TadD